MPRRVSALATVMLGNAWCGVHHVVAQETGSAPRRLWGWGLAHAGQLPAFTCQAPRARSAVLDDAPALRSPAILNSTLAPMEADRPGQALPLSLVSLRFSVFALLFFLLFYVYVPLIHLDLVLPFFYLFFIIYK